MKLRIKNYRRFIAMLLICALLIFGVCWAVVSVIQKMIISSPVVVEETLTTSTTSPRDPESPYLIIVSENSPIDITYVPLDLTETDIPSDEVLYLDSEAALQAQRLFEAAAAQDIDLYAMAAYISGDDQQYINDVATEEGETITFETVAGGQSEHQTGLALDVSSGEVDYALRQDFALSDAGKWLIANAKNYGFIIRYPQGKESSTGVIYSPWHLRYVGLEDAQKITENGLSLEEYMGVISTGASEDANSTTTN